MFASLYTPNFHLQAALQTEPTPARHPVALLESGVPSPAGENIRVQRHAAIRVQQPARRSLVRRPGHAAVFQLNPAAARDGVHPGMTASQALARCPELRILERNPDAEQTAQQILLDTAAAFTPDFENTAPGIVTLDLLSHPDLSAAASAKADQFAMKLAAAAQRATRLDLRAGLAENPDLALLAARLARKTHAKVIRARPDEVRGFLAPLPIDALDPSPQLFHVLNLWGIHTVGDFTALPLTETADRLGPEAVELRRATTGGQSRLLRLVRPPRDFSHRAELEYGIETLDPLLFLFRRALDTIAARLEAAWLVAATLTLTLTFADGNTHRHAFRIPDPTSAPELLFQLLHTHLDDFSAPSPVTGFTLEAVPTKRNGCQFHLFESRLRDPNRFYETLARLEALLGPNRVGTPQLLPTHRPDAFTMTPFTEINPDSPLHRPPHARSLAPHPRANERAHSGCNVTLPLRRFRPPIPLNINTNSHAHPAEILTGEFKGRILDHRGPWLHSGDWWDHATQWSREEWDIHHENTHLYRLTHDHQTNQWLLEGTYA